MSPLSERVQPLRQAWQTQWAGMSVGERRLLTAAAWLAALTLLVMLGVRPAWRTLQSVPTQMQAVETELAFMRQQADEAQKLRQHPPVPPVQAEASLQAATARLGASANLSRQGDRIVLNFQGVSGEALATWLEEVRVGARARPLEAAWQLGAEGAYQGTATLSLGVGGAQ